MMEILKTDNMYQSNYSNVSIGELLKGNEKRLASFVGPRQSGSTSLINSVAKILAYKNIDVAILDMTKNKAFYYIYTQNKEAIRLKLKDCFKNLSEGKAEGLQIENNLTLYTNLPSEKKDDINDEKYDLNIDKLLETLLKRHQVVLIDSDFSTNIDFFAYSQQIYIVQTMDILTIQELTEFLSMLKIKNALNDEKIRIILNKYIDLEEVSVKQIIENLAFYNDPSMSYMQQLFEKNGSKYTTIPYSQQAYVMHLQDVAKYQFSIPNESPTLLSQLESLAEDVING